MNEPIIILEGVDGAGKTTLARILSKRLRAVYTHHSSYDGIDGARLAALYSFSMLPALCGMAPVVLDRAWHSEPIYGRVFRGGHDRIGTRAIALEQMLQSVPSLVVVLEVSLDEAWQCVSARPDQELAKRREQLDRIYTGYQAALWPAETLRLERLDRTPEQLCDIVIDELKERML